MSGVALLKLSCLRHLRLAKSPAGTGVLLISILLSGCNGGAGNHTQDEDAVPEVAVRHAPRGAAIDREAMSRLLLEGIRPEPSLQMMTRLNTSEIRDLLAGRTITHSSSSSPQSETFGRDGTVIVQMDRFYSRGEYLLESDALCMTSSRRALTCRAIYRDGEGRFYQYLYGSNGRPTPIAIR